MSEPKKEIIEVTERTDGTGRVILRVEIETGSPISVGPAKLRQRIYSRVQRFAKLISLGGPENIVERELEMIIRAYVQLRRKMRPTLH